MAGPILICYGPAFYTISRSAVVSQGLSFILAPSGNAQILHFSPRHSAVRHTLWSRGFDTARRRPGNALPISILPSAKVRESQIQLSLLGILNLSLTRMR